MYLLERCCDIVVLRLGALATTASHCGRSRPCSAERGQSRLQERRDSVALKRFKQGIEPSRVFYEGRGLWSEATSICSNQVQAFLLLLVPKCVFMMDNAFLTPSLGFLSQG